MCCQLNSLPDKLVLSSIVGNMYGEYSKVCGSEDNRGNCGADRLSHQGNTQLDSPSRIFEGLAAEEKFYSDFTSVSYGKH